MTYAPETSEYRIVRANAAATQELLKALIAEGAPSVAIKEAADRADRAAARWIAMQIDRAMAERRAL